MGADWRAAWIWTDDDPTLPNRYAYARRAFELPCVPETAVLHCCADSRYVLYVNGRFLGRGPARYHVTAPSYDTYDIQTHLRAGPNVVAVLVHFPGCSVTSFMPVRGALLCQVELGEQVIGSDDTWRMIAADGYRHDVRRMGIGLGWPEVLDCRREPAGWTEPDFDDSDWPAATALGPVGLAPWGAMEPRDIPHLYEMPVFPESVREVGRSVTPGDVDPLDPASVASLVAAGHHIDIGTSLVQDRSHAVFPDDRVTRITTPATHEACYMVIDFAREVVGYPVIEVNGCDGAIVDIGYSECLTDGRVDCLRGGVNYADRYVLRDGGQRLQPVMPRAFRFMHLEARGAGRPVEVRRAYMRFSTYPVEYYGSFECSDPTLNQVWDLGTYTTQLCMEDSFIDCPSRGRRQSWLGARIEALVSYYAFGDTRLVRRGLRQASRSQEPGGDFRGCCTAPDAPCSPESVSAWVVSLYEYFLHAGDAETVAELLPCAVRALSWLEHYRTVPGPGVASRRSAAQSVYTVWAFRHAQRIAAALGQDETAREIHRRGESLAETVRARLLCSERGALFARLPDGAVDDVLCPHTNAMGVLAGVVSGAEIPRLLDAVFAPGAATSPAGTPFLLLALLQVLYRDGRHQVALDCIRSQWGRMLDHGATTCWENWAQTSALCHGWSGGATADLSAEFLGVRPLSPGYATFAVRPRCCDLAWMKGIVPTPYGEIDVAWVGRPDGPSFEINVTVPDGTLGRIAVPEHKPEHWQSIELDGARVWRAGIAAAPHPQVRTAWTEAGYIVFEVEPGRYAFSSSA